MHSHQMMPRGIRHKNGCKPIYIPLFILPFCSALFHLLPLLSPPFSLIAGDLRFSLSTSAIHTIIHRIHFPDCRFGASTFPLLDSNLTNEWGAPAPAPAIFTSRSSRMSSTRSKRSSSTMAAPEMACSRSSKE